MANKRHDRPPDPEQDLARAHERVMAEFGLKKICAIGFIIVFSLLAMSPLAKSLAGKSTAVNVNIALAATVTMTLAWGATGVGYLRSARENRRLNARNEVLQGRIAPLERSLQIAEERIDGLLKDLKGARQDAALRQHLPPPRQHEVIDVTDISATEHGDR